MGRRPYLFCPREKKVELGPRTRIMGVVNLTPDSFFDGGRLEDPLAAIEHCIELVEEGADILDLGGESSRPGAQVVSVGRELDRLLPVLEEVRKHVSVPISIDTYKAEVARQTLIAGADIINDISAFRFDLRMPGVVSQWKAGVILMHMRGNPQTMQKLSPSPDILTEIRKQLQVALDTACEHRIASDRIAVDPGIGFGKTFEDNLKVLNNLSFLEALSHPILVGPSRKSFLGRVLDLPPQERLWGTAASVVIAILRGAHMVRVHDVEEIQQVVKVTDSILEEQMAS